MTVQYPPLYTLLTQIVDPKFNMQWANQSGPRPDLPYIELKIGQIKSHQSAWRGPLEEDGTQQSFVDEEASVTFDAFGEGAYMQLVGLRRKFNFESVSDQCSGLGFCIFDRGTVTNISGLLDKQFDEERAVLEIRMRYCSVATDQVGIIESVAGTVNLYEQGTILVTGTFDVTVNGAK